ncbi:Hypothetical protein, putative [Bodo saltans]|uniref:Uncharacterized protein n=1 Tax=Bodo saltans TaxID=75058 RepID=A0A0S4IRI8_BODSA|nr:Hypothetical protein, putative [Bodo saltans]|eukprot:CUG02295.1 Hypothetical protein, putative [Bodo saltans]
MGTEMVEQNECGGPKVDPGATEQLTVVAQEINRGLDQLWTNIGMLCTIKEFLDESYNREFGPSCCSCHYRRKVPEDTPTEEEGILKRLGKFIKGLSS